MQFDIRPMALGDLASVAAVVEAGAQQLARREGREPRDRSDDERAFFLSGMRRFVEIDPEGAWVATDGGAVIGMTTAIRRESFWGLSMLFVRPEQQSQGVGARLLEAALRSAEGAEVRMILSSPDPRALRRYSLAGLDIHPAVKVTGTVAQRTIPEGLPAARAGDTHDLDLVRSVDSGLRGSRASDTEYLLGVGAKMHIVDRGSARGYVVHRQNRLVMLGASDERAAAALLWAFFAQAEGEIEIWGLTARQNWAVQVALAARLQTASAGALFVAGRDDPPGPWLPSGWYF